MVQDTHIVTVEDMAWHMAYRLSNDTNSSDLSEFENHFCYLKPL